MRSKKGIVFSALIISLIFLVTPFFITVGKVKGIENENAEIYSGKYAGEYVLSVCDHSYKDKDIIIGKMDGSITSYAFSTSCEKGCIYISSSGRGEFYMPKRMN